MATDTQSPPTLDPLPIDRFPEEVTIPLTIRRVGSGLDKRASPDGTAIGTYAMNSPHMSAPVAFTLGIPAKEYTALVATENGPLALQELIANESGNQICALVDRGSLAKRADATRTFDILREHAAPEHAAAAVPAMHPSNFTAFVGRGIGVAAKALAQRVAFKFPEDGFVDGKPRKAVIEIDGVGPDELQVMLRQAQEWSAADKTAARPMVGAVRGELEREEERWPRGESRALNRSKFVVDQVGTESFDILRVNEAAAPAYRVVARCETRDDADFVARALSGATDATAEGEWLDEHATQFFAFDQLPPQLQDVSRLFYALARRVVALVPRNQQRTMAMNKLVEAKDCAVRAAISKTTEERKRLATKAGKL